MLREELRLIRCKMNLSQDEFGLIVGASQKQISTWENGKHRIPDMLGLLLKEKKLRLKPSKK